MQKDQPRFREQDAPLKNTDKAFVRVSNEGFPEIPQEQKNKEEKAGGNKKTSDKRQK